MNQTFNNLPFALPSFAFILIYIWSIFWKGVALWKAAQGKQKTWFIAMLILNTVGILEIFFLFKFAKKKLTFEEIKSWLPKR